MASNNRNSSNIGYETGSTSTSGLAPPKRGRPPSIEKKLQAQAMEKKLHAQAMAAAMAAVSAEFTSNSNQHQQQDADVVLPISRIRTIMKSSPDVVQIGHESLVIMAKATEYFIQHLAREAFERRSTVRDVDYRDLATYVQEDQGGTEFLHEILPHKVKVCDLASLAKSHAGGDSSNYDDEDDYSG